MDEVEEEEIDEEILDDLGPQGESNDIENDPYFLDTVLETDQLGPAFKLVFESSKEKEKQMIKKLQETIIGKQHELEDICNFHFQEFVSCVDNLLELRSETADLKKNLQQVDIKLQASGSKLLKKSTDFVQLLRVLENSRRAKKQIRLCLSVLNKTKQIQQSLDAKMHILALRQLEELQNSGLEGIGIGPGALEWAKYYYEQIIPSYQHRIRSDATDKFNEWLYTVRDLSPKIGQFVLGQSALCKINSFDQTAQLAPSNVSLAKYHQRLKYYAGNLSVKSGEASLFDHIKVDFVPVYQCLHIHDILHLRAEFQKYYQENRKLQCNLALQINSHFSSKKTSNKVETREKFAKYFQHIAGFFIIEDTVHKTTTDFLPRQVVGDLWRVAISKINIMVNELMTVHNPEDLTHLIDLIGLFTDAIQAYSYDISPLVDLLSNVSEKCADIALEDAHKHFVENILQIFDNDKYEPLQISRKSKQYQELIKSNDFEPENGMNLDTDLMVFSFSEAVPVACNLIKHFLTMAHDFSQFSKKPDEQLSNTLEQLMMHLRNCLVMSMNQSYNHANIAQLVQIHSNLNQFILFTGNDLQNILTSLSHSSWIIKRTVNPVVAALTSAQQTSEEMLINLSKDKINSFMSLISEVDWQPKSSRAKAHEHIQDFTLYLEALYQMIMPLTGEFRTTLLTRVHVFIGDCFTNLLRSDEVSQFNANAVQDLKTDIAFLLAFAKKYPAVQKPAMEGFKQVNKTLDILLSNTPDEYLDAKIRAKKYKQVNPECLAVILQKLSPKPEAAAGVEKLKRGISSINKV